MTSIRKIVTSKIDGNGADNSDTNEIRPFGETSFYLDGNGKLTLLMFDGVRTHRRSKVLAPGLLFGSNADAGDLSGADTIKLIPDAELYNNGSNQYIVVDPTGGVPGHIHLRAGGTQDQSTANLYLGGEQTFVRVSDTSDDVAIRTGLTASIENVEVAVVDEFVPPGGVWRLFINDSTYPTLGNTVQIGETVTTTWGTPVTATIVDIQQDAGNWQIHVDQDITVGFNPFNTVTFNRGSKTWTFDGTGNLTLPNGGEIRTDGTNIEVGAMTNFNVEAAGVANIYTDDGAYQWQFGDDGSLTVPGNIKNTTTLGGEISIITASTQGDPSKTWTFTHDGQGALLVPDGSAIRSENRFHITPYNSSFENFTNIVDFDTNSFVEFTEINIINPAVSILDKINPASPNYIGGTGAKVRLIHEDNRVHETTLTGGFASTGTDPGTGLLRYTANIPYFNISASLIKDLGIGTSATWQFSQDGSLQFPDATTTTGKSITLPVDQSLTVNTSYSMGPGGATTFKINPESIKLPTGNGFIYSGTEITANRWSLDSTNKTLFFPDAGDGVYPQINYSNADTVTGMELITYAKSIKITAAQTNSWTFGANGTTTFPNNSIKNSLDNSTTITTQETLTANNSYTNVTDFSTDVDLGGEIGVIAGWYQRNLTQIEFALFGNSTFQSYLTGLALGRTVIVTYNTAGGTAILTGTLTQTFSGTGQSDPNNPTWSRVSGRIDATLPVGQLGIVSINFPVYSTGTNNWNFGADGGLTFPDATAQTTAYPGVLVPADGDTVSGSANLVFYDGSWNYTSRVTINPTSSMLTLNGNSGTGGITFPDSTVQTTAYTGTGAVTFTGNEIEGNTFGGTGTIITKTVDNTGNDYSTGGGSLGFLNFGADGNIQNVKAGWTVTFASGVTRTVSQDAYQPLGTYWNIGFNAAYTWSAGNVMPVTFSSPDYVAGSDPEVTLTAGTESWTFDETGRTTFPNGVVPEHSYGAAGDKEGMVVFSDSYIYYCKQDYVNNTTDIWVRVAWTGTNW